MKKILLTAVVLAIMLIGWMLLRNKKSGNEFLVNTPTPTVSPTPLISPKSTVSPSPVISSRVVIYTDLGYTLDTITIKKGETIIWKNESKLSMWTASAVHPTHKVYPGTDMAACGTQTLLSMFDSCAGVASGESWSFKFDNVGTWGYHNHLNSSHWGKIVVE